MYQVFKFGGASVKDSESVRNISRILNTFSQDALIIVVSAMGKTTNALEELLKAYFSGNNSGKMVATFQQIKTFHYSIAQDLLPQGHSLYTELDSLFDQLQQILQGTPSHNFDYEYDRIVSFGELLSTLIVSAYLNEQGLDNRWLDAREVIHTDSQYREANILWEETQKEISRILSASSEKIFVTQGFIGSSPEKISTTLGREGSDYTAAAIAWCVDAPHLTIWKDVAGVFNADPKKFPQATLHSELSYFDALELAYYGAQVIHPKTIKPLENKHIPLYVRSFIDPELPGTRITSDFKKLDIPSFITKDNQVLYTVSAKDFSFITEANLKEIFLHVTNHRLRINLMQTSALTFSFCTDFDERRHVTLLESLCASFKVHYNTDLTILTVRHYTEEIITSMTADKEVILVEQSRNNAQILFAK